MKPGSIFMRANSVLPESLSFAGGTVCDGWMSVHSKSAHEVDANVRASGWHFMWLNLTSLQVRTGFTPATAIDNAMRSGLGLLDNRFNTAELMDVSVRKYPGFHVARVKLASRHIQECASLGLADEIVFRVFPGHVAAKSKLRNTDVPRV